MMEKQQREENQPKEKQQQEITVYGKQIRYYREIRKWSLFELSVRSGVSESHISHIENGIRKATVDVALKIANAFEIPLCALCQPKKYKNMSDTATTMGLAPATFCDVVVSKMLVSWMELSKVLADEINQAQSALSSASEWSPAYAPEQAHVIMAHIDRLRTELANLKKYMAARGWLTDDCGTGS